MRRSRGPARRPLTAVCGLLLLALGLTPAAAAAEPLHQRIDRAIAAGLPQFAQQAAGRCADAEFLRRVYLDLTGTIPTSAEARAFLDDPAADKRSRLIDRLLASPEHARHLQNVFDVFLMERRPSKHVPQEAWREYLRASFAANKPYDQLVREILAADGADPATRPAARFLLDREGEPHQLTKDISRLFLGRDYACNQCHDSPVVSDFTQADYHGIYAFLNRSFVFTDAKKQAMLADKAEGDVSFESVFEPGVVKKTGPRLPGGPPLKEPTFPKGQEYQVAPAKNVRPVPKFSRRSQLAPLLASRDNAMFKRNSANRLWALLLGRGLVHPVDLDHGGNPPSHPELLTLLADEFAASGFNVRTFLREIALSETYQRASVVPPGAGDVAPDRFAVGLLKPLSPEHLAWSVMQATGLTDAERAGLKKPTEQALYAKLAPQAAPVIAVFAGQPGAPEGQSFEASLDQALFLRNGPTIRAWLAPRPGNLMDRLARLENPTAIAEELYLSVLSRRPSSEEQGDVAAYLQARTADRPAALQEMAWALLASAEFRFNH